MSSDAEPKYLIAVQPIPTNDVKKHCKGLTFLKRKLIKVASRYCKLITVHPQGKWNWRSHCIWLSGQWPPPRFCSLGGPYWRRPTKGISWMTVSRMGTFTYCRQKTPEKLLTKCSQIHDLQLKHRRCSVLSLVQTLHSALPGEKQEVELPNLPDEWHGHWPSQAQRRLRIRCSTQLEGEDRIVEQARHPQYQLRGCSR